MLNNGPQVAWQPQHSSLSLHGGLLGHAKTDKWIRSLAGAKTQHKTCQPLHGQLQPVASQVLTRLLNTEAGCRNAAGRPEVLAWHGARRLLFHACW